MIIKVKHIVRVYLAILTLLNNQGLTKGTFLTLQGRSLTLPDKTLTLGSRVFENYHSALQLVFCITNPKKRSLTI